MAKSILAIEEDTFKLTFQGGSTCYLTRGHLLDPELWYEYTRVRKEARFNNKLETDKSQCPIGTIFTVT